LCVRLERSDSVKSFAMGILSSQNLQNIIARFLKDDPSITLFSPSERASVIRRSLLNLYVQESRNDKSARLIDLNGFRLDLLTLMAMDLSNCVFDNAKLTGCHFFRCNLSNSDLRKGEGVPNARFTDCQLQRARLP